MPRRKLQYWKREVFLLHDRQAWLPPIYTNIYASIDTHGYHIAITTPKLEQLEQEQKLVRLEKKHTKYLYQKQIFALLRTGVLPNSCRCPLEFQLMWVKFWWKHICRARHGVRERILSSLHTLPACGFHKRQITLRCLSLPQSKSSLSIVILQALCMQTDIWWNPTRAVCSCELAGSKLLKTLRRLPHGLCGNLPEDGRLRLGKNPARSIRCHASV